MEAEAKAEEKKVCEICKFSDTNDFDYGKWSTSEDCTIHYFCALLSSDLVTNGADNEGIEGFLVKDIRELCKAYSKTKCSYCYKRRATVRCCEPKCKRIFHVVCGIKKKCLNQFVDQFESYCHEHAEIEEKEHKHAYNSLCLICREQLGEYDKFTSIPSCCVEYYYHKACMQKHAITSGLLAKCPSCGDDPVGYRRFLSLRGIFCPIKDADYELSKDAYQSLLYVHKRCDADECHCPNGREYIRSKGDWMYYCCTFCGSVGTHAKCREDGLKGSFSCRGCVEKHTQSQGSLNGNIRNDADEVNDSNANPRKRSHKFDEEGEGKVWKVVPTNDNSFKTGTFRLVTPDEEPNVSPDKEPTAEEEELRQMRINAFLDTADFSSKPRPPPWLI